MLDLNEAVFVQMLLCVFAVKVTCTLLHVYFEMLLTRPIVTNVNKDIIIIIIIINIIMY